MKQIEDMPGLVADRKVRPGRQFPFANRLSQGEVAALRRSFKAAMVPSTESELAALRARAESGPPAHRSDCLKAIGQLALGRLNQAGFENNENLTTENAKDAK